MPAEKATGEAIRYPSGSRRSNEEAARPPSAIPARTTASINANAVEWPMTNSKRKRNQTTSRERRQNPETKAATSHGPPAVQRSAAIIGGGPCGGSESGRLTDSAALAPGAPFPLRHSPFVV